MSKVFHVFNESDIGSSLFAKKENERSQSILSNSKSFKSTWDNAGKSIGSMVNKPKGLSIRSKSDSNIDTIVKGDMSKRKLKDCKKLENKQCTSKVLSSNFQTPKIKSYRNTTSTKLSPNVLSPIAQNVPDDFAFSKPLPVNNSKQLLKYPEPEKLAYDLDCNKFIFDELLSDRITDIKFCQSINKVNEPDIYFEDEGFISDLDYTESFIEDELNVDFSEVSLNFTIPLPDIPEIED